MIRALRDMLTPALATLLLLQLLSGFLVSPLFALFPVFVEKDLGRSPVFSGNIRAFFVLMSGSVALVGGAVCDAVGRKPAYLLGMTGVIAAGLLFLLTAPPWMYALAVYSGLMFGLGAVAGQSYLMDAAPRAGLAVATASFFMMGTIGNAVGSAAAGWIANEAPRGYQLLGGAMSAGHLLLLLAAARWLPALPRGEAPQTLRELAGGLGDLFRRCDVWALLGLRFLPTVYWGATTLLMPLLLFRLTGDEKAAGNYTSASLVVAAACQMGMGRIVDRVGPRGPVLVAVSLVTAAALGQGLASRSVPALVAFGLLGSGAAWSLSISMTTLIRALSTESTRARLLGITHVFWSAGFLGGTLLAGHLGRVRGQEHQAFLVAGGCCLAAVAGAVAVVSRWSAAGER